MSGLTNPAQSDSTTTNQPDQVLATSTPSSTSGALGASNIQDTTQQQSNVASAMSQAAQPQPQQQQPQQQQPAPQQVTNGAVANPNSSAPKIAAIATSLPLISLPSVSMRTLLRSPF